MRVGAVAAAGLPSNTSVGVLMSRPVLTVRVDESLWDAWQLLFVSGLRHLVVVDEAGTTLGILSDRNILAEVPATAEHLGRQRVRDVLSAKPLAHVSPSDEPMAAVRAMVAAALEAVPVLDDDQRLVGIVTESDIVRWLAA